MTDNIEVLARQRLALIEQIEDASERVKAIDALLIDAVEVGGAVTLDGVPVFRVQQRRTFDVDKAVDLLPPEIVEAATVPTVDPKILKSMMPPALVDAAMRPGATFVAKAR